MTKLKLNHSALKDAMREAGYPVTEGDAFLAEDTKLLRTFLPFSGRVLQDFYEEVSTEPQVEEQVTEVEEQVEESQPKGGEGDAE